MRFLWRTDKDNLSIIIFASVIAKKQAEIQRTIDDLKREVDKRDLDIRILQKNLKEAENVLVGIIDISLISYTGMYCCKLINLLD